MFLIQRVLNYRLEHADLFRRGSYVPLRATGTFADCCIAFARQLAGERILVVAPRLSSRVGFPPIADRWKDTAIELAEGFPLEGWKQVLTGHEFSIKERQLRVADVMALLPVAMLAA